MYETQFLVEEGATPAQVDRALTGFGMAMGMFAVDDMAGLDVGWRVQQALGHFSDPRERRPLVARSAGRDGPARAEDAARAGIATTSRARRRRIPRSRRSIRVAARRDAGIAPRAISDEEIVERAIYALVNEGARVLEAGVARARLGHRRDLRERLRLPGVARRADVLRRSPSASPQVLDRIRAFHREHGDALAAGAAARASWPRAARTFRELGPRERAADVSPRLRRDACARRAMLPPDTVVTPGRSAAGCASARRTPSGRIRATLTERLDALGRARARPHLPRRARRADGAWRAPDLRDALERTRARRAGAARSRPVGRAAGRRSCRATASSTLLLALGRDARRRAVRADLAGLLAGLAGLRQAARTSVATHAPGPGLRGRRRALRARARAACRCRTTSRWSPAAPAPSRPRRRRSPRCSRRTATAAVDDAHARVGPDTIAKFLFTSGSTRLPKGVINTQRMLCANQEMIRSVLAFLGRRAAGARATGCRGTTPSAATTTSASCSTTAARSTSTTASRRRPAIGDDAAQPARDRADRVLQRAARLRGAAAARCAADAALRAALLQPAADAVLRRRRPAQRGLRTSSQRLAVEACGERMPMVTGLGATETAPFALCTGAMPARGRAASACRRRASS